ncbi:MAG: hypothetical protein HW384_20 [Dehalococcoidia bacterium]|nr:hypothetical protein [Dehalococcoidia bacterium]
MADESLEPALAAAVDVFKTWWKSQQAASAATDEVKTPVFHYTI